MRAFAYSLTLLCLMSLSGCLTSSEPPMVVAPPVTIPLTPPDALLRDCPPIYAGPYNTVRDLNTGRTVAENARNQCQADKEALRRWKSQSVADTKGE
jgi:hypothetical protein